MILDTLGVLIRVVGVVVVTAWMVLGVVSFIGWMEELATYRQPPCRVCGHRHGPAHELAHNQLERLP